MSLMARVPDTGITYPLLGKPQDSLKNPDGYKVEFPTFVGSQYDASTTNLTYRIPGDPKADTAQSLEVTISFLSPITPTSTLRQSIPASYVSVLVKGNIDVDIYMDMNGQWVSGDRGSKIRWAFDVVKPEERGNALNRWRWKRYTELLLSEHHNRAEWGELHFLAPLDAHYESGTSAILRQRFATTGALQDVNDEVFRPIMDSEPVFAYSKSFNLSRTSASTPSLSKDKITFTIAHIQDPVVQFASARGLTMMKPLWESWFFTVDNLLTFHYHDFDNAQVLATNYSSQLALDAYLSGAEDYVDIVALSARQVLGATSFSGTSDNPILFLKEISSNGNSQTIDVIFPSFPFFLYTNPRWLAYILEPLIEHMMSGQYPNDYAMHDLGKHFPNMTGHPDGKDEYMPVEECGNMLIMGLAVVNSLRYEAPKNHEHISSKVETPKDRNSSGSFPLLDLQTNGNITQLDGAWVDADGAKRARKWVKKSYQLWKQWTGYLVKYSLLPENQLSTDDFAGWLALQTNLALKGIIGINAMSELSGVVGNKEEQSYYKNISDTYISKWEGYGLSRDKTHAKVAYDWYGSWTTLYNMYADALLCFHLDGTEHDVRKFPTGKNQRSQKPLGGKKDRQGFLPRHIYSLQSEWYLNVRQKYGLPLDSRHLYTKSDWEFFAMAVSSEKTRHEILQSVALWVNETSTDRPLTDLYNTEGDGGFPGPNFFARPVVGGHFAFLALERACKGKAMDGLEFLNSISDEEPEIPELPELPEPELPEPELPEPEQPEPELPEPELPEPEPELPEPKRPYPPGRCYSKDCREDWDDHDNPDDHDSPDDHDNHDNDDNHDDHGNHDDHDDHDDDDEYDNHDEHDNYDEHDEHGEQDDYDEHQDYDDPDGHHDYDEEDDDEMEGIMPFRNQNGAQLKMAIEN